MTAKSPEYLEKNRKAALARYYRKKAERDKDPEAREAWLEEQRIYSKVYRKKSGNKYQDYNRRYYQENKERLREYSRKYREEHREYFRNYMKEYRQA